MPIIDIPNASVIIGRTRSNILLTGSRKIRTAVTPNILSSMPLVFASKPSETTFSGRTSANTPCENIRKKAPANARVMPGERNKCLTRTRFGSFGFCFLGTYLNDRRTKNAIIAMTNMILPLTAMTKAVLVFAATIPPYAGPKIAASPTKAPEIATPLPRFVSSVRFAKNVNAAGTISPSMKPWTNRTPSKLIGSVTAE